MPNWWAEFFWSRDRKPQAAFRRGFTLGILFGVLAQSMLINLFGK